MSPLLEVSDLNTIFYTERGIVPAVNGISFSLQKGETLGIVGESGCGKSVTALSLMRLVPSPAGKTRSGKVLFKGEDILQMSEARVREIRGSEISMIFQEPMTSLNPVYTIGSQLDEVYRIHHGATKEEARDRSIEMLKLVGIPAPEKRVKDYPHSLSGGMRQRVMIAMALACEPEILICDEPTTALDVTIQAQILDLMKKLQTDLGVAIIFISHDLGVISEVCDNVMVMYTGKSVESGTTKEIFSSPSHPYTEGLLKSIPRLGADLEKELHVIEGMVPDLLDLPEGCNFSDRCKYSFDKCKTEKPLLENNKNRKVRCFRPVGGANND